MPKATVSTDSVRYELKTCPPDGFVVLRALNYGQMLDRREKAAQFTFTQTKGKNVPEEMAMNIMQRGTRLYEFQHCIVEHNLEGEDGQLLNFRFPATLDLLDPKIGQEIEELIDALHQPDDDLDPFTKPSPTPSSGHNTQKTPESTPA